MTTNGATFRLLAEDLRDGRSAAGSTSPSTRCAASASSPSPAGTSCERVLDGIDAAKEAGFDPVKINVVLERGVNDDEIVDFADVGTGAGSGGPVHRVHAARRRRARGSATRSCPRTRSSPPSTPCIRSSSRQLGEPQPADRWLYADGRGDVGVIPSVTKPFCGDCDRVRLTAEGQLRTCLFETRRVRSSGASCAAGAPTTTSPRRSCVPSARSGPATRSARSRSSAPTAA